MKIKIIQIILLTELYHNKNKLIKNNNVSLTFYAKFKNSKV